MRCNLCIVVIQTLTLIVRPKLTSYKLQNTIYIRVTKKVGVLKASEMVKVDAHHHIALTTWANHRSWPMR